MMRYCGEELGLANDEFIGGEALLPDGGDFPLGTADFLRTVLLGLGRFWSKRDEAVRRLLRSLDPIVSVPSSPPLWCEETASALTEVFQLNGRQDGSMTEQGQARRTTDSVLQWWDEFVVRLGGAAWGLP